MKLNVRLLWIMTVLLALPSWKHDELVAFSFSPGTAPQLAATGKEYPDGHGRKVYFPLGDISFADEVVSFNSGEPAASNERDRDPRQALGIPNYDKSNDTNYTTLGCGGTLTLSFWIMRSSTFKGLTCMFSRLGRPSSRPACRFPRTGKTGSISARSPAAELMSISNLSSSPARFFTSSA